MPGIVDPKSTTSPALLSASWEMDLWGRIRRETEAARANLLATEEARRGVTLTLISSVIAGIRHAARLRRAIARRLATAEGRKESVDLFEMRLAAAGSPNSKCRRSGGI
jgi:multidrug efflux system outer membrane protein